MRTNVIELPNSLRDLFALPISRSSSLLIKVVDSREGLQNSNSQHSSVYILGTGDRHAPMSLPSMVSGGC